MRITLLEIEPLTKLLIYIIGACISLAIFYYTVKAAVKYGILEANETKNGIRNETTTIQESLPNHAQAELQKKYDKGELSFEEYKKQWEKLK